MIGPMNRTYVPLLALGLILGFLVTYFAVRGRDLGPLVVPSSAPAGSPDSAELERNLQEIAELEARLEVDPENLQLLVDLANLYFDAEAFATAGQYYERALAITPNDPNLRTDYGTALYYSDRVEEAVDQFEESLRIQPNHPQTLFNLGVVALETLNDPQGAIAYWERLIAMNPGYPRNNLVQEQIDRLRSQM